MRKIFKAISVAILVAFMSCQPVNAGSQWGFDGNRRVTLEPNSSVPVTLQDQTTPTFIGQMNKRVDESTLAAVTAIDDYTLTLADATGFVDKSVIVIINTTYNRYWFGFQVGAAAGNVITVDRPLDFTFEVGDQITTGIVNMAVNGAVTPQIFSIRDAELPEGIDVTIDIVRIIIVIYCDTTADLASFGDLTELTKGCTLRRVDGYVSNILNLKSNGDIGSMCFDMDFYTAAGQGQDGVIARLTFGGQSKMGTVIRLGQLDDLEFIINDDLTDLDYFAIFVEGSIVVE